MILIVGIAQVGVEPIVWLAIETLLIIIIAVVRLLSIVVVVIPLLSVVVRSKCSVSVEVIIFLSWSERSAPLIGSWHKLLSLGVISRWKSILSI